MTELDRTTWPELRDCILHYEDAGPAEPRTYPGYPRFALDRVRPRLWPSLDRVLRRRRSTQVLRGELPSRRTLSGLLHGAHGITAEGACGPVPSAGALQAIELYVVMLHHGWLPAGAYHYDRGGHFLSQVAEGAGRETWQGMVPSLPPVTGGALLWVLVGDGERVRAKYARRGERFLLLEAGHLMQNLCLLSASLGLCTVPLGGFFERDIARSLQLPRTDHVLYLGVCGVPDAGGGHGHRA